MRYVSGMRTTDARPTDKEGERVMRRLGLGMLLAVVTFALLAPASPAAAAPSASSAVSTFPMTCDGQVVTLTIGGGPWSAARIAETGDVFVPVATHVYLRDPTTGEVVYEEHDYKGAPRAGGTLCVEEFDADGLLGTFVVEGDVR
jgi:hypothetical protein